MEILYVVGLVIALILAFMPWAIYIELKSQGRARSAESRQLIALLSHTQQRQNVRRCFSCGIAVSREDQKCPACGSELAQ